MRQQLLTPEKIHFAENNVSFVVTRIKIRMTAGERNGVINFAVLFSVE